MAQPQKGLQATLIHCRNPKKGLQVQQQIAESAGFAENLALLSGIEKFFFGIFSLSFLLCFFPLVCCF